MQDISVNSSLQTEALFVLFKQQLKKDFEGAGLDAGFAAELPQQLDALTALLTAQLSLLTAKNPSLLPVLLYRIDISEQQLKKYAQQNAQLPYEEMLAELIIRRVLQKVILKKNFSS